LVKKRGGLLNLLSKVYANHRWDKERLLQVQKKASQWRLYKTIKEILPVNVEVLEEFVHSNRFADSGMPMTFDIYVPSLKLAFEYQGYHHFHTHNVFGDPRNHQRRDNEKQHNCTKLGISLVEVPYWWQRDKESLLELLHKHRPDVVLRNSSFLQDQMYGT